MEEFVSSDIYYIQVKYGHPSMHFRLMKQLEESVLPKMRNMRRLIIVEKQ